jgi:hypothetical protein
VKKNWKPIVILAAVAVVGLSVVAVASGAAKVKNPFRDRAACGKLMSNPKAAAAMQALRDEHRQEMQEWYKKFGTAPASAEAKAALMTLRKDHWNDMKTLFDKLGIKVPKGVGPGICGGQGGMMGDGGNGSCGGAGAGCAGPGPGNGDLGAGYGGGMMGGGSY